MCSRLPAACVRSCSAVNQRGPGRPWQALPADGTPRCAMAEPLVDQRLRLAPTPRPGWRGVGAALGVASTRQGLARRWPGAAGRGGLSRAHAVKAGRRPRARRARRVRPAWPLGWDACGRPRGLGAGGTPTPTQRVATPPRGVAFPTEGGGMGRGEPEFRSDASPLYREVTSFTPAQRPYPPRPPLLPLHPPGGSPQRHPAAPCRPATPRMSSRGARTIPHPAHPAGGAGGILVGGVGC